MKAIVIKEFGAAEQLQTEEVAIPAPGEGQVLIKVKAIGINPVDTKVRAGSNRIAKNLTLPVVIGWDVSGEVVECGDKVHDFKKGDVVFGCIGFPGAGGGYAAYAVADEEALAL